MMKFHVRGRSWPDMNTPALWQEIHELRDHLIHTDRLVIGFIGLGMLGAVVLVLGLVFAEDRRFDHQTDGLTIGAIMAVSMICAGCLLIFIRRGLRAEVWRPIAKQPGAL